MLRTRYAPILITVATILACNHDVATEPVRIAPSDLAASLETPEITDDVMSIDAVPMDFDDAATLASAASAENAATGARAGGHADFVAGGVRSMYTFTSLSTIFPAAKGRFELHRWFPDGRMLVMTGEVECMTVVPRPNGGLARMAGRVEQLRVDNVEIFVPPAQDRAIWTVLDNGEGSDNSPDVASGLLNFRTAAEATAHCSTGLIASGFLITRGNIQVKPE